MEISGVGAKASKKLDKISLKYKKKLSKDEETQLLTGLKERFSQHSSQLNNVNWEDLTAHLQSNSDKLWKLNAMEMTGGEPNVVGYDDEKDEYLFYDCSPETPDGRRHTCYDQKGEEMRIKKGVHPAGNAQELAEAMGIEMLDEEEYRFLQTLGDFDTKTSSWIVTPEPIRKLGGAIYGDKRYDHVFVYHNGAHSFYGARGFRGSCRI